MRIVNVSIYNFRCLKEIVDLPLQNFSIFIGENDSGKSSILDALDILFNGKAPSSEDYFISETSERSQEIVIRVEIEYSSSEPKPEALYLSGNGNLIYRVKYSENNVTREVLGTMYQNDLLNVNFQSIKAADFDEILNALGIHHEGRRNSEIRLELLRNYKDSNNPETMEDWVSVNANILNEFLPRYEKYSTSDYKNPESMILKTLQSVVEATLYQQSDDGGLKLLIQPLAEVKGTLKCKLDERISDLYEYVQRYNSQITGLEIEPIIDFTKGFQTGKLYLSDSTGSYHILNKGEGTRKRLFMSILDWDRKIMLETDSRPVVRAYDEPDANLHYDAQRKMYYCLRDLTEQQDSKIQALLCTHSLTMIDRAPALSIKLVKHDRGRSAISYLRTNNDEEVESFLTSMTRSMGISNSSIFYERCFIFVEGPTEEHSLPILYNKLYNSTLVEDGIKIINIDGCGGWENYVKLLGINKSELILFLLDSDCKEENSSCTLSGETLSSLGFDDNYLSTSVFYIGAKEYEDAFDSSLYLAVLDYHWPAADGGTWTVEEIESLKLTDKFSKMLEEAVWKKSRLKGERRCSKPKLGMELAKFCDRDDIPSEIKALFERARHVAQIL